MGVGVWVCMCVFVRKTKTLHLITEIFSLASNFQMWQYPLDTTITQFTLTLVKFNKSTQTHNDNYCNKEGTRTAVHNSKKPAIQLTTQVINTRDCWNCTFAFHSLLHSVKAHLASLDIVLKEPL